jgi:hypothetical protein
MASPARNLALRGWLARMDRRDARQRAGALLARRTAADDDNVVAAHVGSSLPACSRTMYSAYQSGQSASCWPIRFSCSP